jgi:hypothetical protein
MGARIRATIETTPKKTFASAIDWSGWSRSARTPADAMQALVDYADRYRIAAEAAGETVPSGGLDVEVVETNEGNGGTAFGVPSLVTGLDRRPTGAADGDRLARLVAAAWTRLDEIAAAAPEELRKGPRGGGRNTSKIVEHTLGADHGYAQAMGIKAAAPTAGNRRSIEALRSAMLEVLRHPSDGSPLKGRWTVRYAAHRIAWHSLDHAWEIEDKSRPEADG